MENRDIEVMYCSRWNSNQYQKLLEDYLEIISLKPGDLFDLHFCSAKYMGEAEARVYNNCVLLSKIEFTVEEYFMSGLRPRMPVGKVMIDGNVQGFDFCPLVGELGPPNYSHGIIVIVPHGAGPKYFDKMEKAFRRHLKFWRSYSNNEEEDSFIEYVRTLYTNP